MWRIVKLLSINYLLSKVNTIVCILMTWRFSQFGWLRLYFVT